MGKRQGSERLWEFTLLIYITRHTSYGENAFLHIYITDAVNDVYNSLAESQARYSDSSSRCYVKETMNPVVPSGARRTLFMSSVQPTNFIRPWVT
jgi:hypothetical protein